MPARDDGSDERARSVDVERFGASGSQRAPDRVAHEEPLEIQVEGRSLAVLMRTPGDDLELATGFLLSEGVVRAPEDLASVHHFAASADVTRADNVVRASLRPGVVVDWSRLQRQLVTTSSCGVCGKTTLEAALREAPPLEDPTRFPAELFYELPVRLRAAQPVFRETGGLHAAGLFEASGALVVAREDVGRHNAVDKVIGWAARAGRLPLDGHVLLVSGRISYEIVQKALAARLPVVAAISAPSSLAVDLAERAGIGLVGFLRGRALNVYGRRDRIVPRP